MYHVKQELRRKIQHALQTAEKLPPEQCCNEIRSHLSNIQAYCKTVGKAFIFIEERITCDQRELGGHSRDLATLFRGPSTDASVAICITDKGSLLHRNDCIWQIYKDAGDISPLALLGASIS